MQAETSWMKKRLLLLVAIFGLGLLVLVLAPPQFLRPLQNIFTTLTTPFENVFSWIAFEMREGGEFFGSIRTLKEENERLNREVLSLHGDQALLKALRQENEELRKEIGLEPHLGATLLASEVIARSEGGLSTILRINRGESHGVKVGMPVVASGNILIGRIHSTAPFSSEVRLLSHHESLIAAMAEEITGQMIVRGDHGVGLLLDLARPTDTLKPGMMIMTSGLSDGFPAGLLIGTIQTVRSSADQLFQQASIVPPVRADGLRFVSVMTSF